MKKGKEYLGFSCPQCDWQRKEGLRKCSNCGRDLTVDINKKVYGGRTEWQMI